jgi:hypothetical protein
LAEIAGIIERDATAGVVAVGCAARSGSGDTTAAGKASAPTAGVDSATGSVARSGCSAGSTAGSTFSRAPFGPRRTASGSAGVAAIARIEVDLALAVESLQANAPADHRDLGRAVADRDVEDRVADQHFQERGLDRELRRAGAVDPIAQPARGLAYAAAWLPARQDEAAAGAGAQLAADVVHDQPAADTGGDLAAGGNHAAGRDLVPTGHARCKIACLAEPLDHAPAGLGPFGPSGQQRESLLTGGKQRDREARQPRPRPHARSEPSPIHRPSS